MKRILITGGAGFIGSHCAELFSSLGHEVGIFDIKPRHEATNVAHILDRVTYIEGDVRDPRQLQSAMEVYDYVLHLAAIVSVQESMNDPHTSHTTNVTGTFNVFETALGQGVRRVVYASSAAVYGDTQTVPTPETERLAPLSPYGLHKVINEQYGALYSRTFGLSTIGLRFFNVYGSRQDPTSPYSGVISIFAHQMQSGTTPTIFGDGSATRDFIHVSDVALFCLRALEADDVNGEVCNVGSETKTTITDLVNTLNTVLSAEYTPNLEAAREGDILHSCSNSQKAYALFSHKPGTTLVDGLREVCKGE